MSLVTAGVLGLAVELAVPPTTAVAEPLSGSVNLADLGGTVAGATFSGIADFDHSGYSVSTAGDVNGDGLADLVIGAPGVDLAGNRRGQNYLVYGQPGGRPLSGPVDLADVGGAVAGAIFSGANDNDQSGFSVSTAGDVNGDGLDDLVIGAVYGNNETGQSYLVYGRPDGSPLFGSLNLANVGGSMAGAAFNGIESGDRTGGSVSGAGDVNGDGLDDLLIGATHASAGGSDRGRSYLVYGQPANDNPLSGGMNLINTGGTLLGATFNGIGNWHYSGWSVSGAGDINGDSLDDFLIAAPSAGPGNSGRGQTYLVYGQPAGSPLSGAFTLADVGGAVAGATFNGIENYDRSSWSVSAAGDVNGDGLDDLVIGGMYANNQGQIYLIYGQDNDNPLSGPLDLADLGGAVAGAIFNGIHNGDYAGRSVSGAGDVNGDGLDDLLIGAINANQVYLVYGQPNAALLSGSLDLADVGGAMAGATFNGVESGDLTGVSVSGAGDVNGDGLADLLLATPYADATGSDRGQSYLVYGRRENRVTWVDPGNNTWDDHLNWFGFEGPVAGDEAFIQPTNGLTVSGPTSATQMDSLTLGAQQAGTANLVVDPAGALLIDQAFTIEADGRLSGSGTVTATGKINNQGEIDLGNQGLNLAGGILTNTGVVRGGGTIDNRLINSASGEVRVAAGQQMHLTDTLEQGNAGRIDVVGNATQAAELEFDGRLTNAKITGNITARHAIMRFSGGLTNQGNVGVSFGTSDVYGDVDNQSEASIAITGYSSVTFWDDLTNNGTVKVSKGSTAVYFGKITGSGFFPGAGMHLVEGDLSPGNSPGTIDFSGDVIFGAAARLESELEGTTAGSKYDQLDIGGSVNLDGTLDLLPLSPYTDPGVRGTSDDFVIVTAATRSGNFHTVQYDGSPLVADFAGDASGSFRDHVAGGLFRSITYTATTVQLQNLLALPGDTDGDQDVDLSDYNRLTTNFDPLGIAGPHTWLAGNFDADTDIDLSDYNWVATNFNPGGYGSSAVPEPISLVLVVAGLLTVVVAAPGTTRVRQTLPGNR
jgi:hypothetical protein